MTISSEKTKYHSYAFSFEFDLEVVNFCRNLKDNYGWQHFCWDSIIKKWCFSNPKIIADIKKKFPTTVVPDDLMDLASIAKDKAVEDKKIEDRAMELKLLLETDFEPKNVKGNLYPYQKIGVQFFVNNKGRAILADTMGTGKTCQSLSYVAHEEIKKTLVVCPASMKYAWAKEANKWTHLSTYVVTGKTKPEDINNDAEIIIINYDIVKKFFKELSAVRFECLILDECHYCKNSSAQRTKLVTLLSKKIPKNILLSGTPLLSRPSELFNGLSMMDPHTWNNYYSYATRYCGAHHGTFGWNDKGASNIEELQKKISRYFLRRTKEQILPDLPKKRFIDIPVSLTDDAAREYQMAMNSFEEFLRNIKDKSDDEVDRSKSAEALVKLGYLRQITTRGKMKHAEELIADIVESGEKVVVFSCYNEPLEELHAKFSSESCLLIGSVGVEERQRMVDDFQVNPNTKIFFGGIKSAGVGITLTAATNVVFIDFPWVPADKAQATDRIHRIGSTADSIAIYQLYANGTIDEMMSKLLEQKQKIFDQLIDGKMVEGQKSLISDLIKMLKQEADILDKY